MSEYNRKYQTKMDNEINEAFPTDVARLVLKMIHRYSPSSTQQQQHHRQQQQQQQTTDDYDE